MIAFDRFVLANGLKVLVNTDMSTPLVSMVVLYDVGSKDEDEEHTGFAHLFEHLMFGGSLHIANFDEALQLAGGSNNAYTTCDLTCYYCTLPAVNIETAFWLESDRMLSLAFTPKSLEVQRSVVIEEFKEHYLNAPYGDIYHLVQALNYKQHPYRWPTIGRNVEQIERATMEDVRAFFAAHYYPANAILVLSGGITTEQVRTLCDKWFAPIPSPAKSPRLLPEEPRRTEYVREEVERDVPTSLLYMSFQMPGRRHKDYVLYDMLTDILSLGRGGRFNAELVRKQGLFSSVDASVDGTIETGLVVITGMLMEGVSLQEAEEAVWKELARLAHISAEELLRVQNLFETDALYQEIRTARRAELLAEYELYGDASAVNSRVQERAKITTQMLEECANATFTRENCRTLYYRAKQEGRA